MTNNQQTNESLQSQQNHNNDQQNIYLQVNAQSQIIVFESMFRIDKEHKYKDYQKHKLQLLKEMRHELSSDVSYVIAKRCLQFLSVECVENIITNVELNNNIYNKENDTKIAFYEFLEILNLFRTTKLPSLCSSRLNVDYSKQINFINYDIILNEFISKLPQHDQQKLSTNIAILIRPYHMELIKLYKPEILNDLTEHYFNMNSEDWLEQNYTSIYPEFIKSKKKETLSLNEQNVQNKQKDSNESLKNSNENLKFNQTTQLKSNNSELINHSNIIKINFTDNTDNYNDDILNKNTSKIQALIDNTSSYSYNATAIEDFYNFVRNEHGTIGEYVIDELVKAKDLKIIFNYDHVNDDLDKGYGYYYSPKKTIGLSVDSKTTNQNLAINLINFGLQYLLDNSQDKNLQEKIQKFCNIAANNGIYKEKLQLKELEQTTQNKQKDFTKHLLLNTYKILHFNSKDIQLSSNSDLSSDANSDLSYIIWKLRNDTVLPIIKMLQIFDKISITNQIQQNDLFLYKLAYDDLKIAVDNGVDLPLNKMQKKILESDDLSMIIDHKSIINILSKTIQNYAENLDFLKILSESIYNNNLIASNQYSTDINHFIDLCLYENAQLQDLCDQYKDIILESSLYY